MRYCAAQQEVPGVRNVAISAALPLSWKRITPMLPEGQVNVPLAQRPFIDIEAVSPQWFQTLRVPLRSGRDFTVADNGQAPKVLIVNETFARQFWPGQNPVGKHIVVGRWTAGGEVVGVAEDIKNRGLGQEPQPQVYIPFAQLPWNNMYLLVRTAVPAADLDLDDSRTGLWRRSRPAGHRHSYRRGFDGPVAHAAAIHHDAARLVLDDSVGPGGDRYLRCAGVFGGSASARTRYSSCVRREKRGYSAAGSAARARSGRQRGRHWTARRFANDRVMSSLLYKVGAHDPMTFLLAPLLFLAVAVVTSYLPARRATKVDPMEAMR